MVRRLEVILPPGCTLADLLTSLDISDDAESLLFVINGKIANEASELNDKDVVDLIPALSGGY
jgi:sulfur carrier protein ThiS